jgi:acyl transferase domain-containing protein
LTLALPARCTCFAPTPRPSHPVPPLFQLPATSPSAEYNTWVLRRAGQPPTAYGATGGAPSVASGRLAFVFGLRGAAVSIDTACSSSLVAAHFAAGQIGGGASSGGVAAGVGLILSPESTAMFAKAGGTGRMGAAG